MTFASTASDLPVKWSITRRGLRRDAKEPTDFMSTEYAISPEDEINDALKILNRLSARYTEERDTKRFAVNKAIHLLWQVRDGYRPQPPENP